MRYLLRSLILLLLLLLLAAAGGGWWIQRHLSERIEVPKLLYIPKGSTRSALAYIDRHYFTINPIDPYLIKHYGYPQAGWIDTGGGTMSRAELFRKLTHAKAAMIEVTLIPGETTPIILDQLAQALDLNRSDLQHAYDAQSAIKEGVLVPDTYALPRGIDAFGTMTLLIERAHKRHEALSRALLGHYDPDTWFRKVVVIASIIQKEAGSAEEMPLVSAVIHNRLKRGMKLQMDGTLNYGRYSHQRVTPRRIREDKSRYNTYRYGGLPPYPVCIVSREAIEAALKPADVPYLYFVRTKSGHHHFSSRYSSHIRAIKRVKNVKKRNTQHRKILQKVTPSPTSMNRYK